MPVNNPSGGGSSITVDSAITDGSTNPVQNNAIHDALADKFDEQDVIDLVSLMPQGGVGPGGPSTSMAAWGILEAGGATDQTSNKDYDTAGRYWYQRTAAGSGSEALYKAGSMGSLEHSFRMVFCMAYRDPDSDARGAIAISPGTALATDDLTDDNAPTAAHIAVLWSDDVGGGDNGKFRFTSADGTTHKEWKVSTVDVDDNPFAVSFEKATGSSDVVVTLYGFDGSSLTILDSQTISDTMPSTTAELSPRTAYRTLDADVHEVRHYSWKLYNLSFKDARV